MIKGINLSRLWDIFIDFNLRHYTIHAKFILLYDQKWKAEKNIQFRLQFCENHLHWQCFCFELTINYDAIEQ